MKDLLNLSLREEGEILHQVKWYFKKLDLVWAFTAGLGEISWCPGEILICHLGRKWYEEVSSYGHRAKSQSFCIDLAQPNASLTHMDSSSELRYSQGSHDTIDPPPQKSRNKNNKKNPRISSLWILISTMAPDLPKAPLTLILPHPSVCSVIPSYQRCYPCFPSTAFARGIAAWQDGRGLTLLEGWLIWLDLFSAISPECTEI